ncbi:unnamed protein product [Caenorhabditis angaria]|uniref:Uncharacterized protein n=1 Tax=Caenorhabditis angaria TaxID=860376 RepID=A0A9P1N7M5_9PELO|nr:unnamed protein product [Caenorhabditis angaria]
MEPQTTVLTIDDNFEYPYGAERFFGLGLVALNPVFYDNGTFQFESYGFHHNTTIEMIRIDKSPFWKYHSEKRRMCHDKLYE